MRENEIKFKIDVFRFQWHQFFRDQQNDFI